MCKPAGSGPAGEAALPGPGAAEPRLSGSRTPRPRAAPARRPQPGGTRGPPQTMARPPPPPRRGEPLLPPQICRSHSLATDCDRGRWAGSDSPAPPRGRGRRGPAAALPAPPKVPPRAAARPPQAHVTRPAAAAAAAGAAAAAEQSGAGEPGRPGERQPLCPGGGRRRGAPRPAGTRGPRPPQDAPPRPR